MKKSEAVMKKSWDGYLSQQLKKPKVRAAFEAEKKAPRSVAGFRR